MSSSSYELNPKIHVALLPGCGMGHLTPFLRLAASLTAHRVQVTFITPNPTVSLAESQALSSLFTNFPEITQKQFLLPTETPSSSLEDPFYYHFETIRHSAHLLSPILSSVSPRISALITDMSLTSAVIPVTKALRIPNYVFFTSSAKMLTVFVSFHAISASDDSSDYIDIAGSEPIPKAWVPPQLVEVKASLLKSLITENGKQMIESDGILVNTFEDIDQKSLEALNSGNVIKGLPPVIPVGPLQPYDFQESPVLPWLDDQPVGSVLYVSFGSRTTISREQTRELGEGLVRSGYRFLWVVKGKKVDREDDDDLDRIIGKELIEKVNDKGLILKDWVNQDKILSHAAIGAFLSHCGWNSVNESIWHGVPMLAWPQHGDQKINAYLVEKNQVGIWPKSWGWGAKEMVKAEEIGRKVKEIMEDKMVRLQVRHMKEEAKKAAEVDAGSKNGLTKLIETMKKFKEM